MTDAPSGQVKDEAKAGPQFGRTVGLVLIVLVGGLAALEAVRLGVLLPGGRGIGSAGPGLFPFVTALGVIVFGLAALIPSLAAGGLRLPRRAGAIPQGLISVGFYVGALVFYALVLAQIGFALATAITVAFILRFAEGYRWRSTLLITAITVVACYVLFNMLLGANLPAGRLWR